MRKLSPMIGLLILSVSCLAAAARAQAPRLAVVIVVDQMRADYLDRFAGELTGGLARFKREGAMFINARQGHVPTETAPGHAALLTGCWPAQSGIVANVWWDRGHQPAQSVYAVSDPDYLRSPANLTCPTVGDALREVYPNAALVSVSGKDRAAILMGGHKPDLALWYDRSVGQFVSSAYYGKLPDWVGTWDGTLRLSPSQRTEILTSSRLDELTMELATQAVEKQRLGSKDAPALLTVSLSATDIIGHGKGPDSPEIKTQILDLDRALGRFLAMLDARVGAGRYTVALSADHGIASMPESEPGRKAGFQRVMMDDYMARAEKALSARFGPAPTGRKWLEFLASPHAYLNTPLAKERGLAPDAFLEGAAQVLAADPIVTHVFNPADLAAGRDHSRFFEMFSRSVSPRGGDLLLVFKEGVLLTGSATGADHGLPYDSDARVPLILMGAGVRPGVYRGDVFAEDLAPTLALLLGADLKPAPGARTLDEALSPEARPQAVSPKPAPSAMPLPLQVK